MLQLFYYYFSIYFLLHYFISESVQVFFTPVIIFHVILNKDCEAHRAATPQAVCEIVKEVSVSGIFLSTPVS